MMKTPKTLACAIGALAFSISSAMAHDAPQVNPDKLIPIPAYNAQANASGGATTAAAQDLLSTLSEAQRQALVMPYDDPSRRRWSNLPAGIVSRAGLRLGDLSADQQSHLFEFLSAALDAEGYQRVASTMAAEAYLSDDTEAKRLKWAPENYWLAFYGAPAADQPWAWQFGGHHLGLNLSLADNAVTSMSPTFVGTEPAIFSYDGLEYESVRDMHLAGAALFYALDDDQKAKAFLPKVPGDIETGPGNDNVVPTVRGIPAAEMTAAQRELLLAAARKWVGMQPQESAEARMAKIESQIDDTYFAWIGTDELNTDGYFRIQGPSLVIELLSFASNIGGSAQGQGHYHTQYRNLTADYGVAEN